MGGFQHRIDLLKVDCDHQTFGSSVSASAGEWDFAGLAKNYENRFFFLPPPPPCLTLPYHPLVIFTIAFAAPFALLLPELIVACMRFLLRMNALNGTKTYWRVSIILATFAFNFSVF